VSVAIAGCSNLVAIRTKRNITSDISWLRDYYSCLYGDKLGLSPCNDGEKIVKLSKTNLWILKA